MSKVAAEMMQDIEKETVDMRPNYDGSKKEPVVLPTTVPGLLLNGTLGIAVGMATNIPPHNLSEVMTQLRILLITRTRLLMTWRNLLRVLTFQLVD